MTSPASLLPPAAPANTLSLRARRIREEIFLSFWRVLILGAAAWSGIYVWIARTWDSHRVERLLAAHRHDDMQFGLCLFLGLELVYYFYISWAFRRFQDWGLAIWLIGVLAMLASAHWRI